MYFTENKNKTMQIKYNHYVIPHKDFFAGQYMVIHRFYLQNHKFGSILQ